MHSSRLAIVVILSLQNNISTHYKANKTDYKYCIATFQGALGQLSLSPFDRCLLLQHKLKIQDPDPESICGSQRKDDGKTKERGIWIYVG
jgi:hypothetical protein